MSIMKDYEVEFEFEIITIRVKADGKREAKKKALEKLKKKNPVNFIYKEFMTHKKRIYVEEL